MTKTAQSLSKTDNRNSKSIRALIRADAFLFVISHLSEQVNKLIAAIRGVPLGVSLPSPPTHQTQYSIEESVAKMIQSMSMAWGFRVPVYPKISGTTTSTAVLNNLVRNPYAAGLAIGGDGGGLGPPRLPLARRASDHLPLIAELHLPR